MTCSALHAELWGILIGIRLLIQRGFTHVFIESDSAIAISFLAKGCMDTLSCAPLVREIRAVIPSFARVAWGHVFREANTVADGLAKHGMSLSESEEIFDSLPSFCSVPFMLDSASTIYCRGL